MSKILIIPDVHGRTFWRVAEEVINEMDKVVFLGDYLDPYPDENITPDDALNEFYKILEFKDKYPEKVVLLIGNHDMHYIELRFGNASRMNKLRRVEIHELFMDDIKNFQLVYLLEDKYLFSHAGVYQKWLESSGLHGEDLLNTSKILTDYWYVLDAYTWYRGGYDIVGSCVWADLRESLHMELLPNVIQIIGHTQVTKPYITAKLRCLDTRTCYILNTETDEIKQYPENVSKENN